MCARSSRRQSHLSLAHRSGTPIAPKIRVARASGVVQDIARHVADGVDAHDYAHRLMLS